MDQNYDELKFYFNGKKIEENATIEELGMTNNDIINYNYWKFSLN